MSSLDICIYKSFYYIPKQQSNVKHVKMYVRRQQKQSFAGGYISVTAIHLLYSFMVFCLCFVVNVVCVRLVKFISRIPLTATVNTENQNKCICRAFGFPD